VLVQKEGRQQQYLLGAHLLPKQHNNLMEVLLKLGIGGTVGCVVGADRDDRTVTFHISPWPAVNALRRGIDIVQLHINSVLRNWRSDLGFKLVDFQKRKIRPIIIGRWVWT
jgi:hypothetical protein